MLRSLVLFSLIALCNSGIAIAQAPDSSSSNLNVYINCIYCYQEFIRTQITWADFVQDQFVSDVDLTITSLPTGSGGDEFQLQFAGKRSLAGLRDTMKFSTNAINTDNEIREQLCRKVKLGLVRYAACSSAGDCLTIDSNSEKDSLDKGIGSNPDQDPWNAWVFRAGANGNIGAQKVYQSGFFNTSLSASQVKETHKISFDVRARYSEQRYDYDGFKDTYILRSQSANVTYVHSLNEHWSAGAFAFTERSDFSNYDLFQNVAAAVEYNVFPYREAQTKSLTMVYRAGFTYYDFQEETIFNKTTDRIPSQSLTVAASFTKDWGQLSSGVEVASFLNDLDRNHLYFWCNFDVRIFKGLSVNSWMGYSIQRDQVNIRLNGASQEEVLLQQQQLLTGFELNAYVGLTYRFGSIYNNVVNPRFN
ncbi:MAG: hypothetical protein ACK5BL_05475 [Flavobacteriales bacterium]|jgi:hypothetical protein